LNIFFRITGNSPGVLPGEPGIPRIWLKRYPPLDSA
jgi:hypothetical protein